MLARIPKNDIAEVRVALQTWKGRRMVDVRVWNIPAGGGDYVASRKGLTLDAGKLGPLLDALGIAVQHLPRRDRARMQGAK